MRAWAQVAGDLARPFTLYAVGTSTAASIIRLAWKGEDLSGAAAFITAALAGVGVLYGARAWENAKTGAQAAEVEKARVAATPPPGTAQITAAADVDVMVREPADAGELPESEKLPR